MTNEERALSAVFIDSLNGCGFCGGSSDLHEVARSVAQALAEAEERGRIKGLAEAAKVADAIVTVRCDPYGFKTQSLGDVIRALATQKENA